MKKVIEFLYKIKKFGLESIGRYYSSYRAFVIDNEDPEDLSRLILRIPDVTGKNIHNKWAWPKNVYSGKGYGSQCIPEKNTMVWVSFEHGDPQKPLWSHGYHGKDEKPEELRDRGIHWFKTPLGHLIELDDTKKELRITTINNKTLVEKEGVWYFDNGEFGGLIKIDSLVERLNKIEEALGEVKTNLLSHTHLDSTALPTTPPVEMVLIKEEGSTSRDFLENTKVKH